MNVTTKIGRRRPVAAAVVAALIGTAAFAISGTATAATPTPSPTDTTSTTSTSTSTSATSTAPKPVTEATSSPVSSTSTASAAGGPSAAAAYLIKQLVDGTHLEFSGGFGPNYGGTIDIALALAAQGGHNKVLAKITSYISAHVADYADPNGAQSSFPGPFTGAEGKAALLAEVTGNNPHSFGGFDLIKLLQGSVCTAVTKDGSCTAAGDFDQVFSTVGQSLAVLAIARAGDTVPAAAITRLEQLQCSNGGFNSLLLGAGDTCTGDVDSTGFAIQALALLPAAASVVAKADAYLIGAQDTDGGYTGAAGENTNSTALAIQGLLAAGSGSKSAARTNTVKAAAASPAVVKAEAWLAAMQNSDGGFGISAATAASDETATAQSLPAILGLTLTVLIDSIAPSTGGSSGSGSAVAPSTSSGGGGTLAATGTDVSTMLEWALLLIVVGVVVLGGATRRRRGRHVAPARARV